MATYGEYLLSTHAPFFEMVCRTLHHLVFTVSRLSTATQSINGCHKLDSAAQLQTTEQELSNHATLTPLLTLQSGTSGPLVASRDLGLDPAKGFNQPALDAQQRQVRAPIFSNSS
jgi:hypothetical protein